jgi:hypothetical protein
VREHLKIITNRILRDERIERRIIEENRERIFYTMILIGGVLVLIAMLY